MSGNAHSSFSCIIYLIVRYLRMFRVVFVDVFLKINQCILQTRGSSVNKLTNHQLTQTTAFSLTHDIW
jgi:hypothetical protein